MRRFLPGDRTDSNAERADDNGGRRDRLTLAPPDLPVTRISDDEPSAPVGRVVLASAPKIRAVYRCRFWADALRPEFYKNRPIVVVSRDNRLDGPALVVPLTTKPQGNRDIEPIPVILWPFARTRVQALDGQILPP